jgi:hypothetical protein
MSKGMRDAEIEKSQKTKGMTHTRSEQSEPRQEESWKGDALDRPSRIPLVEIWPEWDVLSLRIYEVSLSSLKTAWLCCFQTVNF